MKATIRFLFSQTICTAFLPSVRLSITANHAYRMNLSSDDPLGDKALFAYFDPDQFIALNRKRNRADQQDNDTASPTDIDTVHADLHKILFKYFGYSSFRSGQLEIISSIILQQKDAAFFSPTGKGKSMCYQIPPLYLNQIAVVVSPLISLMQDQVSKLNSLQVQQQQQQHSQKNSNRKMAVFLGSAQTDELAEQDALKGHYSLIYCTPEKLNGSSNFIQALAQMHHRDNSNICLFAIDESHCVSQWGHDFRPQYRHIGQTLRTHPILKHIPILALTATAVPNVQQDIISNLCFRPEKSIVITQAIDRPNLILNIHRKPIGGFKTALARLSQELATLANPTNELQFQSTIVYVPTQQLVDDIVSWLQSHLQHKQWVQPYHAGLPIYNRTMAHNDFLVGKTKVIVATVAFGMGIDKPDIRRVIHYGAPPTMEDYYQQIGRCGRDGMQSHCDLFCDESDFTSYKSSFYTKNLPTPVKAARERNIDSFRTFCMNDEVCRRAQLLTYFGQQVSFQGNRCGTCDTCRNRNQYAADLQRDFSDHGARLMLYAISVLKEYSAVSSIESILNGKIIEPYRYRNVSPTMVQTNIQSMKEQMQTKANGKKWPISTLTKGILPSLVSCGFVETKAVSAQFSSTSINRTWTGYNLTRKGMEALTSGPIVLPVPAFIRESDDKEKAKNAARIAELETLGVDTSQIPDDELLLEDGTILPIRLPATTSASHSNLHDFGRVAIFNNKCSDKLGEIRNCTVLSERHANRCGRSFEDLRLRLLTWRSDNAVQLRISPSSVMSEHLLLRIAYISATLPKSSNLECDALVAAGIRIGNMVTLIQVINKWRSGETMVNEDTLILPEGLFHPAHPWPFMELKQKKRGGSPSWELSYNRFMAGEHPMTIAITQNSRPIQVSTVVGHILTALTAGKSVPLRRLAEVQRPPTVCEWKLLVRCEEETKMDVCNDPKISGCGGSPFSMKDFLTPILGNSFASKEYSERTNDEQEQFSRWCNLLNWFLALRRANVQLK